jgi:hypothetical protein
VDQITTAYDPDLYGNTTLTVTQKPGEATPHVGLSNVPLGHIIPAKLAHHPTEPSPGGVNLESSVGLSKRSHTSPSTFAPRKNTAVESPLLTSPPPFSPTHVPHSNRTGYNALPADDVDIESPVATTVVGPLGDHDHSK